MSTAESRPRLAFLPVSATPPKVSIVLGSYQRLAFLRATIESVRDNGITVPYEIIVVDGGSTDGSVRWLTEQKDVITIVQHNRGEFRGRPIERRSWGYFMNLGFRAAEGRYILMISDDCLLVPGAVMAGVRQFEAALAADEPLGALAFYWRNWPEQREYNVGLTLGERMFVNHGLYKREALAEVGWIDEDRYRFYHADGDLCLRLWDAGYTVTDCPDAYVEHFTHANLEVRASNIEQQQADWATYVERWRGRFELDTAAPAWVSRGYDDRARTYRRFPREERIRLALRRSRTLELARGALTRALSRAA
jgi:GT2 family glycosyltransferase